MLSFGGFGVAELAAKRDGQDADVGRFQAGEEFCAAPEGEVSTPVESRTRCFLSWNVRQPIESSDEAGREIQLTQSRD